MIYQRYRVNRNWIALQILEMAQSSTFMKHWKFPLSRTWNTKRWPPNYDVMIWWRSPRHAPHIWGRRRRCVFDLPYACMCKYPRGSKLSSSNVIRRGEVRWSHNVQFCLKSEVSLKHRGRSRSPVSCARNAADDELSYGHMGGMRLRTNFAAESRVVTWSCGDRSVSKETYCVAYNLTVVWRITF